MRQFIFIISLFVILNSHANSLDASQYPYSYGINDGYVGSGSPTNVNILIPVNGESTQFFRMDFE